MQQLKKLEQFNQVYKKHKEKQKVTQNRFPYLFQSDSAKDMLGGTSLISTYLLVVNQSALIRFSFSQCKMLFLHSWVKIRNVFC
jgi:hypothetical protein